MSTPASDVAVEDVREEVLPGASSVLVETKQGHRDPSVDEFVRIGLAHMGWSDVPHDDEGTDQRTAE